MFFLCVPRDLGGSSGKKNPCFFQLFSLPLATRARKMEDESSGASGGSLHGGASFKVEKAHFAACKRVRRTATMK